MNQRDAIIELPLKVEAACEKVTRGQKLEPICDKMSLPPLSLEGTWAVQKGKDRVVKTSPFPLATPST